MDKFKKWMWPLIIIAVLVIGGFSVYGYFNSIRSEGVRWETSLSAQYLNNQNYLSTYISGFYEKLGLANLKSEKMDLILSDAVKGRYDKAGGFSAQGSFLAVLKEAYPDLKGLNIYDEISTYVSAQREGYKSVQEKLLDMLRAYDRWREDGIIQSFWIKNILNVPSERLKARIGEEVLTGQKALDKMYNIVLASQARDAYKTSTMDPLKVK